jgi:hypothetical protein
MASDTSNRGDPVPQVTRVTLGGAELPRATLWAQSDYGTDSAYLTVIFNTQAPRWPPGTRALLTVGRADGRGHEIPVEVHEQAWQDEERHMGQLRLRIMGGSPWSEVEELLSSTSQPSESGERTP